MKRPIFIAEAGQWYLLFSTWVMGAAGLAASIFLALPTEQQSKVLSYIPMEPWMLPIAVTAVGVIARILAQPRLKK